jgi:hypothetical protein
MLSDSGSGKPGPCPEGFFSIGKELLATQITAWTFPAPTTKGSKNPMQMTRESYLKGAEQNRTPGADVTKPVKPTATSNGCSRKIKS